MAAMESSNTDPAQQGAQPTAPAAVAQATSPGGITAEQLNEWAQTVNQRLGRLEEAVQDLTGASAVATAQLEGKVTELEYRTTQNLQQVADAGMAALLKTIDDVKVELNKSEFYHQQAREGLDKIVVDASIKFSEIEANMNEIYRQAQAADAQVRQLIQKSFADLEARLAHAFFCRARPGPVLSGPLGGHPSAP